MTTSPTSYNKRLTTVTDANGNVKDYRADPMGRTDRVREWMNGAVYATTTYGYDTADRLTDTWDAVGTPNHTHLTYDWLGRKTAMDDPDMGVWAYQYDNAGNLLRQTDARNQSVCFTYDDLNRVTQKQARTGAANCTGGTVSYTVTYGYDSTASGNYGVGRRTSMSDPSGGTAWTYDLEGQLIKTSQTITNAPNNPYVTSSTFDAMGRARSMVYPGTSPETVNLTYNAQGLLETLGGYVPGTTYNASGQISELQFGNGAKTNYTYDPNDLRVTDIDTTKPGTTLQDLHYTYDNVGNVLTMQDNVRAETTTYTYDDLDRLLSASANGGNAYTRTWTYDTLGRMTARTVGATNHTYEYTDGNHPHAKTKWNGATQFVYDANGNMQQLYGDVHTFDVENRFKSTTASGVTTSFVYNGDGQRVIKTVSGTSGYTTYYVGNYYEVQDPVSGINVTTKYYYFGTQRVAMKMDSTTYYLSGDHLGSTSVVVDNSGNLYSRRTYYPYGETRTQQNNALPTDFTFTGQRADVGELMDYGAREYDIVHAQFIQPDTVVPELFNPQMLNRYAYVRNNPINRLDPSGYSDEAPCQSWNNWCWENRYWTAQGKCYNNSSGTWTRECAPTFQDPGIALEYGLDLASQLLLDTIRPIEYERYFLALARAAIDAHNHGNGLAELVYTGILGAYVAVGEVNGNCINTATCMNAFGSILQTSLARLACRIGTQDCTDGYNSLDGSDTIAGVLAYHDANSRFGPFPSYTGLNRWVKGSQSLFSDRGLRDKLHTAFTVALDVFVGKFWNENTGYSTKFVGGACGTPSPTSTDFGATGAGCTTFSGP